MRVAEVGEVFEALAFVGVAWNQVRLGPVGNKNGAGESPGVGGILENLNLRPGVGEEVGNDCGDALFVGGAECGVEEIGERDDGAFFGEGGGKDRFGFVADLEPSLEKPRLGGCGLALAEKGWRFSALPKLPPFLVGQVVFRYVKNRGQSCGL